MASRTEALHKKEGLLYQKVKQVLLNMLEKGDLAYGAKAPSLRVMSQRLKVSISTVMQAYIELEGDGVLESRPKSGFYVKESFRSSLPLPHPLKQVSKPEVIRKTSFILQVLDACTHPEIIQIGSAVCHPSYLPLGALNKAMQQVLRERPEIANAYSPTEGMPELRKALSYRGMEMGAELDEKKLIITNGGNEALLTALRCVTRPGDLVAIESPTYFGVLQILESLGLRALEIPTCMEVGLEMDELKRALERFPVKACVFAPNFNNPVGTLYPDEKKEALVKLLSQKGIPLVEDDIYGDLYFGESRPINCKQFDTKGNVLLCSSVSKTLSPGIRVGWLEPGRFYEEAVKMKMATSFSTATVNQLAVAEFLKAGSYDRHLRRLRQELRTNCDRYQMRIAKLFPEGTRVTQPKGGTVLWIELPKQYDGDKIFRKALEEKIYVTPGSIFSSQDRYRHCLRVNYGRPLDTVVERALETIASLVT